MPRLRKKVSSDFVIKTHNNNDAAVDVSLGKFTATTPGTINAKAVTFTPPAASSTDHSRLLVSDSDTLSFNGAGSSDKPFSVSMWIRPHDLNPSAGGGGRALIQKGIGSGANREWGLVTFSTTLFFRVHGASVDASNYDSIQIYKAALGGQTNNWLHIVGTYSGVGGVNAHLGLNLYVNGSAVSSPTRLNEGPDGNGNFTGAVNTATQMIIGRDGNDTEAVGGQPFDGDMADIIIFNKELSSSEVTSLYAGGKVIDPTNVVDVSSIISWYKMGDGTDSSSGSGNIKDYVGSNHATPSNITIGNVPGGLASGKEKSDPVQLQAPLPFVFGVMGKPSLRHAPQVL